MAGRGPQPKDPDRRVRRNADPIHTTKVRLKRADQPELPGDESSWPEATRRWWATWSESPLAADFTATDWDFLLDTALLHARLWSGEVSVASELRLRVAKFGATPEDRARLRIELVKHPVGEDEGGGGSPPSRPSSKYGELRVLRGGSSKPPVKKRAPAKRRAAGGG